MKHLLYIFATFFLLAACQQEAPLAEKGNGYLVIDGLEALSPVTENVATRAVDADLYIKITATEGSYIATYAPGEAPQEKIEIEAGEYTLEAYNEAYNSRTSNAAQYYAKRSFSIEAERTSYVNLEVPMINVAVKLAPFSDELAALFSNPFLSVSANNVPRTLNLGETAYFDYTEGMALSYTLTATNADGETFTSEPGSYGNGEGETVEAGHCYVITYSLAAASTLQSICR